MVDLSYATTFIAKVMFPPKRPSGEEPFSEFTGCQSHKILQIEGNPLPAHIEELATHLREIETELRELEITLHAALSGRSGSHTLYIAFKPDNKRVWELLEAHLPDIRTIPAAITPIGPLAESSAA